MESWQAAQKELRAIIEVIDHFDFPDSDEPMLSFLQEKMDAIRTQSEALLNHMEDPDMHPIEYALPNKMSISFKCLPNSFRYILKMCATVFMRQHTHTTKTKCCMHYLVSKNLLMNSIPE